MPKPTEVDYGQARNATVWHALQPTEGSNKRRAPAYCGSTPRFHLWHYWRSGATFGQRAAPERVVCRNCVKTLGWPTDG